MTPEQLQAIFWGAMAGSIVLNIWLGVAVRSANRMNRTIIHNQELRYAPKGKRSGLYIVNTPKRVKNHKLTTKRSKR